MKKLCLLFTIALSVLLLLSCFVQPAHCGGLLDVLFGSLESDAKRQLKFINYSDNEHSPKPKDSPVELFFQNKPQKDYEVIGEITGFIAQEKNIRPALKIRVRQVGGDGLIDIQTSAGSKAYSTTSSQSTYQSSTQTYINTPVSRTHSMSVMNISGKVIKYKDSAKP